jgi:hypothetical protein
MAANHVWCEEEALKGGYYVQQPAGELHMIHVMNGHLKLKALVAHLTVTSSNPRMSVQSSTHFEKLNI